MKRVRRSRRPGVARRRGNPQMDLARRIQESLLPPPLSALQGFELVARFCPSRSVGGDFYDYFQLNDRTVGLYLADVQGKGLEGAMYGLLVSGVMRGLSKTGNDPAGVVAFLNRRLALRSVPGKFACLLYALIDLETRQLTLANAGLPFPLLARNGATTSVEVGGVPIGMFPACDYDQAVITLQKGDSLLFFTDGLPDSLESRRPQAGDGGAQIAAVLAERCGSAAGLCDALVHHLNAQPTHSSARKRAPAARYLYDDAAFLALQVH